MKIIFVVHVLVEMSHMRSRRRFSFSSTAIVVDAGRHLEQHMQLTFLSLCPIELVPI